MKPLRLLALLALVLAPLACQDAPTATAPSAAPLWSSTDTTSTDTTTTTTTTDDGGGFTGSGG